MYIALTKRILNGAVKKVFHKTKNDSKMEIDYLVNYLCILWYLHYNYGIWIIWNSLGSIHIFMDWMANTIWKEINLRMRSYFIDYCQIWIPPTKERWDKDELLKVQDNINHTLFIDIWDWWAVILLLWNASGSNKGE